MQRITINIGFITNSSSVVHSFPKEILQDTDVKAFMQAYQIEDGFVGEDLWSRNTCTSLLITPEQFNEANNGLNNSDYQWEGKSVYSSGDSQKNVTLIYGDEYSTLASELCHLMRTVADRLKLEHSSYDFN